MAGPWEKYATQEEGPWTRYNTPAAAPATPAPGPAATPPVARPDASSQPFERAGGLTATGAGVADMAYQQEPYQVVWMPDADGQLLGMTYERAEDVVGWHRHDVGGDVESVIVLPHWDRTKDVLWMIVKRTINGNTVRFGVEAPQSVNVHRAEVYKRIQAQLEKSKGR